MYAQRQSASADDCHAHLSPRSTSVESKLEHNVSAVSVCSSVDAFHNPSSASLAGLGYQWTEVKGRSAGIDWRSYCCCCCSTPAVVRTLPARRGLTAAPEPFAIIPGYLRGAKKHSKCWGRARERVDALPSCTPPIRLIAWIQTRRYVTPSDGLLKGYKLGPRAAF